MVVNERFTTKLNFTNLALAHVNPAFKSLEVEKLSSPSEFAHQAKTWSVPRKLYQFSTPLQRLQQQCAAALIFSGEIIPGNMQWNTKQYIFSYIVFREFRTCPFYSLFRHMFLLALIRRISKLLSREFLNLSETLTDTERRTAFFGEKRFLSVAV